MKTFCAFILAFILIGIVTAIFGGAILLLSTAFWPASVLTGFVSGVLGTAVATSIISKAING